MKMITDFLSREWNLYGLQILCISYIIMVLHNYLGLMGLCCIGLCVYLIAMCQRILGVRHGMLFYQQNESKLNGLVHKIEKMNKEDNDE